MQLYAKAGIPEYWIVNLANEEIEIFQQHTEDNYLIQTTINTQDEIYLSMFDIKIKANEILV